MFTWLSLSSSSEGMVNKIMNSPFGHNDAAVSSIYNNNNNHNHGAASSAGEVSASALAAGVPAPVHYHGEHNAENDPNILNQAHSSQVTRNEHWTDNIKLLYSWVILSFVQHHGGGGAYDSIAAGSVAPNNYLFKVDQTPALPHPGNHTVPQQTYGIPNPVSLNSFSYWLIIIIWYVFLCKWQPHYIHAGAMPTSSEYHHQLQQQQGN